MEENVINIDQEEQGTKQLLEQNDRIYSNATKTNWKTGSDLMKSVASPLKRPREVLETQNFNENNCSSQANSKRRPLNRRRPTETVVRSLASSQLSEKYNQLADKKNVIAEYALKKLEQEIEQNKEEHDIKMQILMLDLKIKKQLSSNI